MQVLSGGGEDSAAAAGRWDTGGAGGDVLSCRRLSFSAL